MRKFKIPAVPKRTNKSIRFPLPLIARVERVIARTDCSFSAFVVAAVQDALDSLAQEEGQE
nr:YlcI/YnfO family protein [Maliibacterium massiliense]